MCAKPGLLIGFSVSNAVLCSCKFFTPASHSTNPTEYCPFSPSVLQERFLLMPKQLNSSFGQRMMDRFVYASILGKLQFIGIAHLQLGTVYLEWALCSY